MDFNLTNYVTKYKNVNVQFYFFFILDTISYDKEGVKHNSQFRKE